MKRFPALLFLLAVVLALTTANASAAAAKFHEVDSSVGSNGALIVSFDQRGLGEGDITYSLTADAEATYACINRGGKNPEAANKQTNPGAVSGGGTFEARNGRVTASLSAGPISAGSFSCPGGQRLVLAAVSYTNIVLTDTTNNVVAQVDDVSRTFFAV
jgi:hypothetical protein